MTVVLRHLSGLTPASPEPLGRRLEAGRDLGLAACAQVHPHFFSQAWPPPALTPQSCPTPHLLGGRLSLGKQTPWESPRLPPSNPSLPPGQYCSQRKCPV